MRAIALSTLVLAAAVSTQTGTFALLGGTPKIVSKFWATHGRGAAFTFHVQQFETSGTPIKAYETDMQHLMHMVIVRDDFATFDHLHPAFDAGTGTFEQAFTKAPNHRYYVYADTTPKGVGQQVFRFTLESDGPYAMYKLSAAASGPNSKAGPYTVTLAKTTFAASTPQEVDLTIESGDDPATDLVPYLGAPAHVVMIDMSTLEYVHIHPMLRGQTTMTMGKAGPFMKLMLPSLPAGTYKTWVQIAGGKDAKVYTAPFSLVVK